jgi:adenosine deaminase
MKTMKKYNATAKRERELGLTVHSGENFSSLLDALKEMKYIIECFPLTRLGHCLAPFIDVDRFEKGKNPEKKRECRQLQQEIIVLIKERGIVIETNPTSNLAILYSLFQGKAELHPLRRMFDARIPVTINTDNPGVFAINLRSEYKKIAEALQLGPFEVCHAIFTSFAHPLAKRNTPSDTGIHLRDQLSGIYQEAKPFLNAPHKQLLETLIHSISSLNSLL